VFDVPADAHHRRRNHVLAIDDGRSSQHPHLRAAAGEQSPQRLGHCLLGVGAALLGDDLTTKAMGADALRAGGAIEQALGHAGQARQQQADLHPGRIERQHRDKATRRDLGAALDNSLGYGKGDDLDRRRQAARRNRGQGRQRSQRYGLIDLV
jgi:hypothetical protein